MPKLDLRLNGIVDGGLREIGDLAALARLAVEGGVTLIQYRDKSGDTRAMIATAKAIKAALAGTDVPVLVNDRVDVALAAKADGVHLGRDDMAPETARALLGTDAIIGVTVKSDADAEAAIKAPVDYACIGGVFETLSKTNPDAPLGIEGFRVLRAKMFAARPELPVGAIAGIDAPRAGEVAAAGADGVAAISAVFRASDVAGAARQLRRAVDEGLAQDGRTVLGAGAALDPGTKSRDDGWGEGEAGGRARKDGRVPDAAGMAGAGHREGRMAPRGERMGGVQAAGHGAGAELDPGNWSRKRNRSSGSMSLQNARDDGWGWGSAAGRSAETERLTSELSAPDTTPKALTIAGSDSGGGAGIQADLKTFSALGVFGTSVITAITAQNTLGVTGVEDISAEMIAAQIDAVVPDIAPGATKIGVVSRIQTIEVVADRLAAHGIAPVLDPVMVATSGDVLLHPDAIGALRSLLVPMAVLVTPNLPEAALLTGTQPAENEAQMRVQGEKLLRAGARAVLIKGGHGEGGQCVDLLFTPTGVERIAVARLETANTHGTGCTLSAAIAAGLAKGLALEAAVAAGKDYLHRALLAADRLSVGKGRGPVHHFHDWWAR